MAAIILILVVLAAAGAVPWGLVFWLVVTCLAFQAMIQIGAHRRSR